jgi:hypothetical protein
MSLLGLRDCFQQSWGEVTALHQNPKNGNEFVGHCPAGCAQYSPVELSVLGHVTSKEINQQEASCKRNPKQKIKSSNSQKEESCKHMWFPISSSETSANFHWTTLNHSPERVTAVVLSIPTCNSFPSFKDRDNYFHILEKDSCKMIQWYYECGW